MSMNTTPETFAAEITRALHAAAVLPHELTTAKPSNAEVSRPGERSSHGSA